ncbi:MAG: hypothetical protein LBN21_11605 [Treponema sp.]|jgi:hypothetical protein|nr:hypothetical protein [Treponema sp.]
MKYNGKVVLFLLTGIMIAGVFSGCSTPPPPVVEEPPPPPAPHVYVPPPPPPPPPPEVPVAPITREIIQQVSRSGYNINKLQYFLSADLVLENEKNTQNVDINNKGEGKLRDTSTQGQVTINRNIGGILVDYHYSTDERAVLEVGFDETNETYTLSFIELPGDQGFELVYDRGEEDVPATVAYGDEIYQLRSGDEAPLLFIKFEREPSTESITRELRGRYLSPAD